MLVAYHNKPENKEAAIACMRMHREADQLVKGKYWQNGKGCAVGCRYKSDDHELAETVDGIPRSIAHLLDCIFEGLPNEEAMLWPERFFLAVPVGADLSKVVDHFMYWLLTNEDGVKKHGASREDVATAIDEVAQLYKRRLSGDEPEIEEWNAAAADACRTAWRAADAADAAWRAADAADADAADAAWRAADAADAIAREQEYSRMSEKLLEIIQNAPLASTVNPE